MTIPDLPKLTQLALVFLLLAALAVPGLTAESTSPMEIGEQASCGKCGMFPARYPDWQTQIVFADGSMVPFDGCKCMFGYLMNMTEYDQKHAPADVAAVWVRDHATGDWLNAREAHYVVGSDEMGPMGKELIPFGSNGAAESFQQEHGGQLMLYGSITMETLKPLMGKMHMKKNQKGRMEM